MPRYRLTAPAFVAGVLCPAGDEITWDGPPGRVMTLLDPPLPPAKAAPAKTKPSASEA